MKLMKSVKYSYYQSHLEDLLIQMGSILKWILYNDYNNIPVMVFANSVDQDQITPSGAFWSVSALLAIINAFVLIFSKKGLTCWDTL